MRTQIAETSLSYARYGLVQQCINPIAVPTRGNDGSSHDERTHAGPYHVGKHIEDLFGRNVVGFVYLYGDLKFQHTGQNGSDGAVQVGGNVKEFLFAHGRDGNYFIGVVATNGQRVEVIGRVKGMNVATKLGTIEREWYADTPELVIVYEDDKGKRHTTKLAVREGVFGCAVIKDRIPELGTGNTMLEGIAGKEFKRLKDSIEFSTRAPRRH